MMIYLNLINLVEIQYQKHFLQLGVTSTPEVDSIVVSPEGSSSSGDVPIIIIDLSFSSLSCWTTCNGCTG